MKNKFNQEVSMKNDRDIEWFEKNRPEHYEFVRSIENRDKKHAIVDAAVKVGKKDLILIQALRTYANPMHTVHVVITNFKRKDCEEQRKELADYNVKSFYADELKQVKPYIDDCAKQGYRVIVHLDELDFGSGNQQRLANVFLQIKDKAHIIAYSATGEEAIYSGFADEASHLEMPDPASYFGADDFLNAGLVYESEPFYDIQKNCFTKQGIECLDYWQTTTKTFAVLRLATSKSKNGLTYGKAKRNPNFVAQLKKRGIEVLFIDGKHPFFWGKAQQYSGDYGWPILNLNQKILLVVNMTCGRSTEVGFHPQIAFWHDHRGVDTAYNTKLQALLRVAHYPYKVNEKYWLDPEVNIRLYGCRATIELAAAREFKRQGKSFITVDDYCIKNNKKSGILSPRIKTAGGNKTLSRDSKHSGVEFFNSLSAAEEFSKEKANEFGKSYQLQKNFQKNKHGFYLDTHRDRKNEVLSQDYIQQNSLWGLGENSFIRVFACYTDITDPTTLRFAVTWTDGTVEIQAIKHQAEKSMYANS